MFNVRLAGGHLYGKQLFTWLSLVVSLMASFVLSFFPLDALDEIWDLIESVSEGFLTYFCTFENLWRVLQCKSSSQFIGKKAMFLRIMLSKFQHLFRTAVLFNSTQA